MDTRRNPPGAPAESVTTAQGSLRVLLALPYGPRYDNLHGGRVTAQWLRRLTRRHHVMLVYQREWAEPGVDPDVAAQCERVVEVGLPPDRLGQPWQYRWNILKAPVVGRPTAVSAQFSRSFAQAVREAALDFRPDVIQLEHDTLGYCAARLRGLSPATIIVSHDPGLAAVEHLAAVTAGRQRLSHLIDARIWRRYWRQTLPRFDAAIVFSDGDRLALEREIPGLRVVTIPLGIDIPAEPLSAGGHDGSVVFVGGYSHQPNADAALRLMRQIMPLARLRLPDLKLVLVGDRPTEEMHAAAGPLDQITGRVEKIDPYVDAAAVVALPIRLGGGMRVKLLEAMAVGKAIVASPLAAAGIGTERERPLRIASSDEEFAAAIVDLSQDLAARERLGREARRWATDHLDWDLRVDQYERLYRSQVEASPAQRLETAV